MRDVAGLATEVSEGNREREAEAYFRGADRLSEKREEITGKESVAELAEKVAANQEIDRRRQRMLLKAMAAFGDPKNPNVLRSEQT